jgi:cholesterol transport system auxiliary component
MSVLFAIRAARGGSLALALALAGCGSLLPAREGPPPALYQLTAAKNFEGGPQALNVQLGVDEPVAPRGLDIDRIAIKPSTYELKYLARTRWSDRAPRMVQTLLIESFDNALEKSGVGRPREGFRADYTLASELRNFEVDDTEAGRPRIGVRLSVKLLTSPGGRLVAAETFAQEVPSNGRSTPAVVAAFDEAFHQVARDTVTWTLDTLGARAKKGERPVAQSEPASPAPASGKAGDPSANPPPAADQP